MAAKKLAAGATKKKKAVAKKTAVLPDSIPIPLPPVPLLREALICSVDEPRRWTKTGLVSSAMPRFAQWAALLCRGDKCFFCGAEQPTVPDEKLFLFHPEYPLCLCLAPFRKMAFDYIENWDSVEGKKQLLAQVEAGKVALDTPVYQYFCQCGAGPVVVDVRTIAYGLRKHQKHTRRRLCNGCYQRATVKRAELHSAMETEASRARRSQSPGARINKIKQAKNAGPAPRSLPPLNEVAPNAQVTEPKAPEKANANL